MKAPWTQAFPNQVHKKKPRVRFVRPVSKKRKYASKIYAEKRIAFLARHPKCQVCPLLNTDNFASQIHHRNGRNGPNYLDENTWVATCMDCHLFIHNNPAWAYANGVLSKRLAKAKQNTNQ